MICKKKKKKNQLQNIVVAHIIKNASIFGSIPDGMIDAPINIG